MHAVTDRFGRPMRSLRISVTDRCNLRCGYCMPEENYVWLPKGELLSFLEVSRLVDRFAKAGVDRVRLTGGEPLLRRDLHVLVAMLAGKATIREVAMTTNGTRLADHAEALKKAGLTRVTISLDTLKPERFKEMTRRDALPQVLAGIEAARRTGLAGDDDATRLKIDTVVIRGKNDDELEALLRFAGDIGAELRFIEYMDVGGATQWRPDDVLSRAEMLARIEATFGAITTLPGRGSAPAERFRLRSGTTFGIIASTTEPFCKDCDRARLTADGTWYHCLYATRGIDLKTPMRDGMSDDDLEDFLRRGWSARVDRGAEQRKGMAGRGALVSVEALRKDPRLEMHTRGG